MVSPEKMSLFNIFFDKFLKMLDKILTVCYNCIK